MEIPYVQLHWDYKLVPNTFSLNLDPGLSAMSQALRDLVDTKDWSSYTIVYESYEAMIKLKELLKQDTDKPVKVSVHQLTRGMSYRKLVKDISQQGATNIILDISTRKIKDFLKQAREIGMMTEYHNYLITSLDLHTIDLKEFQRGRTNITGYRLVDPNQQVVDPAWDWVYREGGYRKIFQAKKLWKTRSALAFDAVTLLALSLHNATFYELLHVRSLSCDNPRPWPHGKALLNAMKKVKFQGLSGLVQFDESGRRINFTLDLLELKEDGMKTVSLWNL
ncbi:glutamate receptor ionotropic, kainate 1-like [Limulus polyphemus]|uniref:Glutamate receptor ionotropic, kainate 1-like n=1 Tax=Limulus polyphemus TaxID=6850 RepID=A0ABM1BX30_LIMPO|nr:glutamate receptor ionotropic, kainate 1-like [Limulus polyphemus]